MEAWGTCAVTVWRLWRGLTGRRWRDANTINLGGTGRTHPVLIRGRRRWRGRVAIAVGIALRAGGTVVVRTRGHWGRRWRRWVVWVRRFWACTTTASPPRTRAWITWTGPRACATAIARGRTRTIATTRAARTLAARIGSRAVVERFPVVGNVHRVLHLDHAVLHCPIKTDSGVLTRIFGCPGGHFPAIPRTGTSLGALVANALAIHAGLTGRAWRWLHANAVHPCFIWLAGIRDARSTFFMLAGGARWSLALTRTGLNQGRGTLALTTHGRRSSGASQLTRDSPLHSKTPRVVNRVASAVFNKGRKRAHRLTVVALRRCLVSRFVRRSLCASPSEGSRRRADFCSTCHGLICGHSRDRSDSEQR